MNKDCGTCKFRSFKPDELSDDCGHHFEMDGVIHYDIPDLSACDKYGLCEFYEKDPDIMDDKQCIGYLENIRDMFVVGSKNCEGQALEYQQKFICAIQYAIAKIQTGDLPHSAASIETFNKAIDALKAERPKGKWVETSGFNFDEFYGKVYKCTNCNKETLGCGCRDYCPNCGADMRGGVE